MFNSPLNFSRDLIYKKLDANAATKKIIGIIDKSMTSVQTQNKTEEEQIKLHSERQIRYSKPSRKIIQKELRIQIITF